MRKLFQQFNTLNILIVGDVMMDSYLWGNVERISPEAPVPIVSVKKKENRLGGAANVALNVQSLGATPIICAIIGNDKEGDDFLELLKQQGLTDKGIIRLKDRPTTVKTRIMGQKQQILRIDAEMDEPVDEHTSGLIAKKIRSIFEEDHINALIFEDYDKGVITPRLITEIVAFTNEKNTITVVDPKKRNFLDYKNVTLFKPNLKELREGLKIDFDARNLPELEQAAASLKGKINSQKVMITLSEMGVYIDGNEGKTLIPAHIRNIADVSGAGDTVIATATACLAVGMDEFKAAAVANLAGGLVCEYLGVVPINKERLLAEAENLK
ncbi:bifunctional heptose 7-phosphate kinase/heptose 1-phosphate adenyltransferase [Rubrolithibacter danxiaensis]|uniref:bifunctional heptose 7-phosphate kinase/heptose 1-phosphate adenyltransferase n=1 Tax=Rubrolithibacter danxiaensis TaxID=3390805 RepID=UPI003BF8AC86